MAVQAALGVVTVAAGGLPVVDVTAVVLPRLPIGLAVTEAANGKGLAVTKVSSGYGLPVVYVTSVPLGARVSPDNMTSNTAPPPYVASSLSEYSAGYAAFNAFNSTANWYWVSLNPVPQWLKIDLGSSQAASSYSMKARTDTVISQATAWTLEGSNNDSTWVTADTRSGIAVVGPGSVVGTWTMATPGTYRYWRWTFTASQQVGGYVECGNLALYQ